MCVLLNFSLSIQSAGASSPILASSQEEYLVIDIFNTGPGVGPNAESYFVPFKGAGLDSKHGWGATKRPDAAQHAAVMRSIWQSIIPAEVCARMHSCGSCDLHSFSAFFT